MNLAVFHAKYKTTIYQGMRFIVVGGVNTAVDILGYFVLTRYTVFFHEHILVTRVVSFLAGSVCSFFLNRLWTFKKRDGLTPKEVIKFYLTIGISLIIGLVTMQFFISVLHLYDLIALGISVLFTFVWNFTASKLWVFKAKEGVIV